MAAWQIGHWDMKDLRIAVHAGFVWEIIAPIHATAGQKQN
jgi:hypothetical protein